MLLADNLSERPLQVGIGHGWDSLGEYSDAAVVDILALLRLLSSERFAEQTNSS
jgi:hypothetical protein